MGGRRGGGGGTTGDVVAMVAAAGRTESGRRGGGAGGAIARGGAVVPAGSFSVGSFSAGSFSVDGFSVDGFSAGDFSAGGFPVAVVAAEWDGGKAGELPGLTGLGNTAGGFAGWLTGAAMGLAVVAAIAVPPSSTVGTAVATGTTGLAEAVVWAGSDRCCGCAPVSCGAPKVTRSVAAGS